MIRRKIQSLIKFFIAFLNTLIIRVKTFLLEENIIFGRDLNLGSRVRIRTTDQGSILIGDNVTIERNCYIYAHKGVIKIKDNCFIGEGSQIVSLQSIDIGENCLIAAYCILRDANHSTKIGELINDQGHVIKKIIINNDVWLGAHTVVLKGVNIGSGAIIGANAVVVKSVETNKVYAGNPAVYIKDRE